MTTANPLDGVAERAGRRRPGGWYATARHALESPLTAYYLLLGASVLLLVIGLIMVLSASSV
jgi:cell division protein FtsW